jgi:LysM repeat protein
MFVRILTVLFVTVVAWAVFVRPSSGAGHEQIYVVKATDTLWSIASRHYAGDPREGIWKLERRNALASTALHPGERLVLP